ncbi:hypothetical protein SERLADRAFT_417908 [Serpula lacrymans var. lacrymans S7.9]|uniref:MULE transposase domain-containing protein n=1 Tax=Serpula lacrymans var. lacrymans (strain S7.9) TaxID=578457 RepID=F8P8T2_SERL9|nr:uncharacterized protein SERLADRAFT_417908 [Serpula lacrymans var. lacrymans S7.9]EGO20838.1 hypothetical protein SERLADRAFT_417908 [Serpula lacrymans var. lacrymans S7.9]
MECSQKSCKNIVPEQNIGRNGLPYKMCSSCREKARMAVTAHQTKRRGDEHTDPPPRQAPAPHQETTDEVGRLTGEGTPEVIPPIPERHDSSDEDGPGTAVKVYENSNTLFCALQEDFKSRESVSFFGSYQLAEDPFVDDKKRVEMTISDIWKTTGYQFTVKDHTKTQNGHKTRLWCCQDDGRKKKAKPSTKPDVKHCDHVGMQRFDCGSQLNVLCVKCTSGTRVVTIRLKHEQRHKPYYDVTIPPKAIQIIRNNIEWSTPVSITPKVQALYPHITGKQVHRAWTEMGEVLWKKDPVQLISVYILLNNTNSKNLKLYSVLGEYDNAGFPLSYCVLSTASALDIGKRKVALTAWVKCLHDTYGVVPIFTHVNKDMAEIGMLREIWDAKIQLCWWHLRQAMQERLAKNKLATTPYNPQRAHAEFAFINTTFVPPRKADMTKYEGGAPDVLQVNEAPCPTPNTIPLHIPRLPLMVSPLTTNSTPPIETDCQCDGDETTGHRKLMIRLPKWPKEETVDQLESIKHKTTKEKRTFCPKNHREKIIDMMERYFCAHPLIPGYSHPSRRGICDWAVKQMYQFCIVNDLHEACAYLWENWYRLERWELWAQSYHDEIPVLKATMILESQPILRTCIMAQGIQVGLETGGNNPNYYAVEQQIQTEHTHLGDSDIRDDKESGDEGIIDVGGIENWSDFADGILYQAQFNDHRWGESLEREGASLFQLASHCLELWDCLAVILGERGHTHLVSFIGAKWGAPARHP